MRRLPPGPRHHPALVVGATGTADVLAAVGFAAARDLPVAVQATGHGVSVAADRALLVSTRRMTGVRVDPAARTARIQAGVRWEQVIHEAAPFGLAPLNSSSPLVGAVAYTLGGGLGPLGRAYGYAADHVGSIEVVTADGRLLSATDEEHAELLWALRGGGGNFGAVTSLELCLHPVGPTVLAGQLLHPRARAPELLGLVRDVMAAAPDELGVGCALAPTPELPFLPEPVRGRPIAGVTLCWAGEPADGERAIGRLRAFGPPVLDSVRPLPYVDAQRLLDPLVPPGRRYQVGGEYLRELPDAAIGALVEQAGRAPSPGIDLVVAPQGGRLARPPETATAFDGHQRGAAYNTQILTGWDDPGDDAREAGWVGTVREALAPWSAGSGYLNFLGDEGPDRVRAAFSPATWDRLQQVKRRYDPDNLFRHNHNIPPG